MTGAAETAGSPRVAATLTGLFIALVVPAIMTAATPGEIPAGTNLVRTVLFSEGMIWALTFILLAIVIFWEHRPLASIGLRRPTRGAFRAGIYATGALMLLAMIAVYAVQAAGIPLPEGQGKMIFGLPIWLQVAATLRAGFCEEVLFRGYAIERLTELSGSRWLGALVPVVIFGAVHAPFWGVGHAIVAGMSGLWLTVIYLWRRNLWTNIVAHAMLDGLVFMAFDFAATGG